MSGRMLLGFVIGFIIMFLAIAFWPGSRTEGAPAEERIMEALGVESGDTAASQPESFARRSDRRGRDGRRGRRGDRNINFGVLAVNFGVSVIAGLFTGFLLRMMGR